MSLFRAESPSSSVALRAMAGRSDVEKNKSAATSATSTTTQMDHKPESLPETNSQSVVLLSKMPLDDNVMFNSVRSSDGDKLDSSPFELEFLFSAESWALFEADAAAVLNKDGGEMMTRRGVAGEQLERALLESISRASHIEVVLYSGEQIRVYTDDLPHSSPIPELECKAVALSRAERHVTLSVHRAFPLSSSHMGGAKFRLACIFEIPGRIVPAIVYTEPFRVLAKMGKKGSKNKQIHMPTYVQLPPERAHRLALTIAAAAPLRKTLNLCMDNSIYVPEPVVNEAADKIAKDISDSAAAVPSWLAGATPLVSAAPNANGNGSDEGRPTPSARGKKGSPSDDSNTSDSDGDISSTSRELVPSSQIKPVPALRPSAKSRMRNAPHRRRVLVRGPGGRFARLDEPTGEAAPPTAGVKRYREAPPSPALTADSAYTDAMRSERMLTRYATQPSKIVSMDQKNPDYLFYGNGGKGTKRRRDSDSFVDVTPTVSASPPHGTATPVQSRLLPGVHGNEGLPQVFLPPAHAFADNGGGVAMVDYQHQYPTDMPGATETMPLPGFHSGDKSDSGQGWGSPVYGVNGPGYSAYPYQPLVDNAANGGIIARFPSFDNLDQAPSMANQRITSMGLPVDPAFSGDPESYLSGDLELGGSKQPSTATRPMGGGY